MDQDSTGISGSKVILYHLDTEAELINQCQQLSLKQHVSYNNVCKLSDPNPYGPCWELRMDFAKVSSLC